MAGVEIVAAPAGLPAARPWYRRRAFVVATGVVFVLAVTVVTDLPTHASRSNDIDTARSILAEVETDVAPCNLGVRESFGFYQDVTTGHISASDRAQIPALIRDDLDACSFTNESIVDLASVEVPEDPAGRELNVIASAALTWCDPGGLTAIGKITNLIASGHPSRGASALAGDERQLTNDRAAVFASIARLKRMLHTSELPGISLVQAP